MSWKADNYSPELDLIHSNDYRKLAEYLIDNVLPEEAFYAEPSSTRKYHPRCTHKPGGLIIHNKRLIFTALNLVRAVFGDNEDQERELSDLVIVAGICHDMCKKMHYSKDEKEEHAAEAIKILKNLEEEILEFIPRTSFRLMCSLIEHHMGPWGNTKPIDDYSKEELLFYFSDYLASRALVELPVDGFQPNLSYDDKYNPEWSFEGGKK